MSSCVSCDTFEIQAAFRVTDLLRNHLESGNETFPCVSCDTHGERAKVGLILSIEDCNERFGTGCRSDTLGPAVTIIPTGRKLHYLTEQLPLQQT